MYAQLPAGHVPLNDRRTSHTLQVHSELITYQPYSLPLPVLLSLNKGWLNKWMNALQSASGLWSSFTAKQMPYRRQVLISVCDESYIGWILSKPSWFFCSFWKLQARPALECWISGPLNKAANSGLGPEEAITLVLQFINHLWNFFFWTMQAKCYGFITNEKRSRCVSLHTHLPQRKTNWLICGWPSPTTVILSDVTVQWCWSL